MKIKNVLLLIVALSLLLCACNDATITTEPEGVPSLSASEQETLSDVSNPDRIPGLPDAYRIKNGKLMIFLGSGLGHKFNYYFDYPEAIWFEMTMEQLKEKMMTLDFTAEELKWMEENICEEGYVYAADPRLLEPLNLPEGCELSHVGFGTDLGAYRYAGKFAFTTTLSENTDWCTQYNGYIWFAQGASGDGETGHYDAYMETNLDDITDLTEDFKCYAKKNGRIYYIDYKYSKNQADFLEVRTFNSGHGYAYFVTNPSEECIENILDYDPFTYLQVEY